MLLMEGCIDMSPRHSTVHSEEAEMKEAKELGLPLQLDYDAEVKCDLFRVQGDLMLAGNGSLDYLLLNATLREDDRPLKSTKYLMLQPQMGIDHSFEISKNMRIAPGEYNCLLEISGPRGSLGCETRMCRLAEPWPEPLSGAGDISAGSIRSLQEPASSIEERTDEKEVLEDEFRVPENVSAQSSAKWKSSAPVKKTEKRAADRNVSPSGASSASQLSGANNEQAKAKFVGSLGSSSKKYHRLDCRFVSRIKEENRIYFQGAEDAKSQGYLPCKVCSP
jgi:hypothetical protein